MSEHSIQTPDTYTVVTRQLIIPSLHCHACEKTVIDALGQLEGMIKVQVDLQGKRVSLDYDAAKLSMERIENELRNIGFPHATNYWMRLKTVWYRFLDDNIRENAAMNADRPTLRALLWCPAAALPCLTRTGPLPAHDALPRNTTGTLNPDLSP